MSDLIEIEDLVFVTETDMAILVKDHNEDKYWLPKSQIEYDEDVVVDDVISVEIPEWLAFEKGLI